MKIISTVLCCSSVLALCTGCIAGGDFSAARGPSPVLQAGAVKNSTENYQRVLAQLIARAGYSETANAVDWYEVARAGFGYVDEQCNEYLAALYRIRKNRDATSSQITAFGLSAGNILALVDAGAKAIAITADAFGLAQSVNNNATSALLFAMDPSDIQSLVRGQAGAYRIGVARQRANYQSSNAAMEAVKGYLNICLPVSIEAQVKATLQGTQFQAVTTGTGEPFVGRTQSAQPVPEAIGVAPKPDAPVIRPSPSPESALAPGLEDGRDIKISRGRLKDLQKKLCVKVDGEMGGETRHALGSIQPLLGIEPTEDLDKGTLAYVGSQGSYCSENGAKSAYENFSVYSSSSQILQSKMIIWNFINQKPETYTIPIKEEFISGIGLNDLNRKSIIEIKKIGMNISSPTDIYEKNIEDFLVENVEYEEGAGE
ncbi:hypothetical protein [Martelella radicis]|uniref:Peptidoglycan binding-like domain-containing protein n=1 Tax=Martelella radicis TaxID=1397476 RepID=A0A7W6P9E3_9HYPH|nr:hypothetical protein [Martelella radicis]MBB4121720.1 hypothetical protein [Martelella radicis]